MSDADATPTEDLVLHLADTMLAAGLQYGLWVERSPSTEEQVALSSMSQDKLGHARAFYQIAEKITGKSAVELQYDRDPEAFRWSPAWAAPLPSWDHVVLAQVLFGEALTLELDALAEGSQLAEPRSKIEQEDTWHTRHGQAWLDREADAAPERLQEVLEDLWPFAVGQFGIEGEERFPHDLETGERTRADDELRSAYLDTVVPTLEALGLQVAATRKDEAWSTDPAPTEDLIAQLEDRITEHRIELAGLIQDPEGRELAELA